jgi:hypothetical protein
MALVDDPLYQKRDLGPHEAYILRCYYGSKPHKRARGHVKEGDLAIEVRLTSKAALLAEIAASRARQERGEIGAITVHISIQPRYRSLYR